MKTINIGNAKGGVGKTTLTVMLSLYLAEMKKRTLVVDMDGQEDLSRLFGKEEKSNADYGNSSIFYKDNVTFDDIAIRPVTNWQCRNKDLDQYLFYVPAKNSELATINSDKSMTNLVNLQKNVQLLKDDFDFVIFDTPPSLGAIQFSCISASDAIVIPLIADFDSCGKEKLEQYFKLCVTAQQKCNAKFKNPFFVLSDVDKAGNVTASYIKWAKGQFKSNLISQYIEHTASVKNAMAQRRAMWFKPTSGNDRSKGNNFKQVIEQLYRKVM